ncbi:hypothetical protein ElyMa_004397300 [Elysia marginata]|uniref:Uncharacterized protein n=1 Tax=Elysia marginata TaxID=1093978 RepID=A0AAV4H7M2_9GAST|nr:hypothetical protein ElyMa_004397300 [Elysia marginata]
MASEKVFEKARSKKTASFSLSFKLTNDISTSAGTNNSRSTAGAFVFPFDPDFMSAATALCGSQEDNSSNVDLRMRNNSSRPDGGGGGGLPLESAVSLSRPHSTSPSMSPPSSPGQAAGRPSRCCFCCFGTHRLANSFGNHALPIALALTALPIALADHSLANSFGTHRLGNSCGTHALAIASAPTALPMRER